jgi:nitric oxide reductase subunit C
MLSKSAARAFFLVGTALTAGAFILLTLDTFRRIPAQTNAAAITEEVALGKELWDKNNCMGCHTLLGEGAYYAPELTRVIERRGPQFVEAMLRNPEAMYPGRRKMVQYDFTDAEIAALIAFFGWIGEMDLNGFPPEPVINAVAVPAGGEAAVASTANRPQVFNQMCAACHSVGGQGGSVGPALDGHATRRDMAWTRNWLHDPLAVKPDSRMPKMPLTDGQIDELAAFLSTLSEEKGQ